MRNATLYILFILVCAKVQAQEQLVPLDYNPQLVNDNWSSLRSVMRTTADDSLKLPFFDDFTAESPRPDVTKWADWHVFINNTMCIAPVSRGVATFDAINKDGLPYNQTNANALVYADSLTSLRFNLSSYAPSDNIYLSFFYQPQGNGFSPETQDSLMLYFLTKFHGWKKVWAKEGTLNQPFKQVVVAVTDTGYLHENFKFRFVNKASVNLNDDVWNVDYIRMNSNRNANDTLINDVAFTKQPTSLLKDYTYMPYHQYMANANDERATELKTSLYNGYNAAQPVTYQLHAREESTNTDLFTGGISSISLSNGVPFEITLPAYNNTVPLVEKYKWVSFENTYYFDPVNALEPKTNDTIVQHQIFHNFFAYDDGTAEKSYFLNQFPTLPAKTAVEYHLNVADTLTGVAIYFGRQVPTGFYKYFSVSVYKEIGFGGGTENLVYQQELLQPGYLPQGNLYVYKFDDPVPLPAGTFYIGTMQPALGGSDSLYLGVDANRTGGNHLYFNVNGYWESSTVSGAIMIRPIVGPIIPSSVTEIKAAQRPWSVYPNPANDELNFDFYNYDKEVRFTITNIEGRIVQQGSISSQKNIDISALRAGIYFIKLQSPGLDSTPQKIIKL